MEAKDTPAGLSLEDDLPDPDLKIILLGDSAVGKSKLIERYLMDEFNPRQVGAAPPPQWPNTANSPPHRSPHSSPSTVTLSLSPPPRPSTPLSSSPQLSTYALTLFRKDVRLQSGESTVVDFWDTAGQEAFNRMHPSYYYRAHCCVLMFDVTRKATYQHLADWYKELREYCEHIPVVLVANKIDVDYNVTRKEFKFAAKHNLPFFFVSAADGTNVVKVFESAILEAKRYKESGGDVLSDMLSLLGEPGAK